MKRGQNFWNLTIIFVILFINFQKISVQKYEKYVWLSSSKWPSGLKTLPANCVFLVFRQVYPIQFIALETYRKIKHLCKNRCIRKNSFKTWFQSCMEKNSSRSVNFSSSRRTNSQQKNTNSKNHIFGAARLSNRSEKSKPTKGTHIYQPY